MQDTELKLRKSRAQRPLPPAPVKVVCLRCKGIGCVRIGKDRSAPCPVCGGLVEVVEVEQEAEK